MGERILVTGGAGFVGSHLVDALVARGSDVTVLDNLDPQIHPGRIRPEYLSEDIRFVEGDVRDRDLVARLVAESDVVSHQAATVGVGQSMYEIARYSDVNVQGTAVLLDVLVNEKNTVRRVVVASSMSVYGEGQYRCPAHGLADPGLRSDEQLRRHDWELKCAICGEDLVAVPTAETAPTRAPNVYALTKKMQEELVLAVCAAYRIPAVALRYFNIYGPRQSLSNPYTGVAAIFMSRLKNGNRPMIFEDGRQARDFVSVHDVVRANLAAIDSTAAEHQAVNIGSGEPCSVRELAQTLAAIVGVDIEPLVTGEYRSGDIRNCYPDMAKAELLLGFEPRVELEDGLRELCEWSAGADAVDSVEAAAAALAARGLLS